MTYRARIGFVAASLAALAVTACSSAGPPGLPSAATPSPVSVSVPTAEGPAERAADPVARGAELYAASCQQCHGDRNGEGGTGAPRHDSAGHTWHHPDAQLKDWILNGKFGFTGMPGLKDKLTESEVDAILVFIRTWWTTDQRATQADVSRRYQDALDKQNTSQ